MHDYICSRCDYTGPKATIKPGSTKWEVFWWLSFPIGPFYTAWRILRKRQGCPQCGEAVMVPVRNKFELRASRVELGDSMTGELDRSSAEEKIEASNPPTSSHPEQW